MSRDTGEKLALAEARYRRLPEAQRRRQAEWASALQAEQDRIMDVVDVAALVVAGIGEMSMLRTALERYQAARKRKLEASR